MHSSRSFLLIGLSVLALGACSSDDNRSEWGTVDDIQVTNRGVPSATKEKKAAENAEKVAEAMEKDAMTTLEKTADDKIVEVQKEAMVQADVEEMSDPVEEIIETAKEEAEMEMAEADAAEEEVESAQEKAEKEIKPMEVTEMIPPPSVQKAREKAAMEKEPLKPVKDNGDLPMNAKPGECYAKVLIPAQTKTTSERVQVSEEQKVLARIIPAQYKVETEEVLVKEAQKVWKPGRGPVERVSETTGEILCLVEEPAVYKTIEKRVLIAPEQPEYKVIPAQFETVTRTEVVEPAGLEWRRILCETNVTPDVIRQIQSALNSKGFDAGVVDGRAGQKTLSALNQFQLRNNLASRGITYESIEALDVKLAGQ